MRGDSWAFRIGISLILLFPFLLGLTELIGTRRGRTLIAITSVTGCILLFILGFQVEQQYPGIGLLYTFSLFFAYSYAQIWRLLARGLAYSGYLIQPYLWPAALLVPAMLPILRIPTTVRSLVRTSLPHWQWKEALGWLLTIIASVLLAWGLIIAERRYIVVNRIMLAIVAVGPFIILWQTIIVFRSHFRDRRLLKEVTNRTQKMGTRDFLESLKALASFETRTQYLQVVRERQLLTSSTGTISTLKLLASRLQRDLLVDKETRGKSGLFDRKSAYGLAAHYNWEFLDNLHLLLEELEQYQS